jgi:D-lactate dehydrogenase (cytochrome)
MQNYQLIEQELLKLLKPEQISTNETVRINHGQDESYHDPALPDIVVFPYTNEDVSNILKLANTYKVPVIPFGAASNLEGQIIPYEGGITIDFNEMNNIISIEPENLLVTVEPGVRRLQLNKALKKHGLFFPVDPGADATLGGMAATNSSGTTAVKYGAMREQVLDLEVVTANGDIIHTGTKAAKSSSGLGLNGLFVGSEGTLGCITQLTLRLYSIPEYEVAGRAVFPSVHDAVQAVIGLKQSGIPIGRVELVDAHSVMVANAYNDTDYKEAPTLFLEFHGNEAGLEQDVVFATDIMNDFNCLEIEFEKDTAARNKLWTTRHSLAYAYTHHSPGKKMLSTDVCVPVSKLAASIEFASKKIKEYHLDAGILGHVGDGNFHTTIMIDKQNEAEFSRAKEYCDLLVQHAIAQGGTCTGEHGVGVGKRRYQKQQHGQAFEVMRAIKDALDPNGILNPGKLL